MKIKIEETVITKTIVEREINFPYIAWWSNKKEEIVRVDIEFYENKPNLLKCTIIQNGWGVHPTIKTENFNMFNGIVEEKIIYILRDYSNIATEIEFKEFLEKTYDDIVKTF